MSGYPMSPRVATMLAAWLLAGLCCGGAGAEPTPPQPADPAGARPAEAPGIEPTDPAVLPIEELARTSAVRMPEWTGQYVAPSARGDLPDVPAEPIVGQLQGSSGGSEEGAESIAAEPAIVEAPVPAAMPRLARVLGRFDVDRTPQGFVVYGWRDLTGPSAPMALTAGMPALEARRQMLSVPWDAHSGLADAEARVLRGWRMRFERIEEWITVHLDPTGRWVVSVEYTRQPALFSRSGLRRHLRADFREGRWLADGDRRMTVVYGPREGTVLRVDAVPQDGGYYGAWRLTYRIEPAGTTDGQRQQRPERVFGRGMPDRTYGY